MDFQEVYIRTDAGDPENWTALSRQIKKIGGTFEPRRGYDASRRVRLPRSAPAELFDQLFQVAEWMSGKNFKRMRQAYVELSSPWLEGTISGTVEHGPGFKDRVEKLWQSSLKKIPRCRVCGVVALQRIDSTHDKCCRDCHKERVIFESAGLAARAAGERWDRAVRIVAGISNASNPDAVSVQRHFVFNELGGQP